MKFRRNIGKNAQRAMREKDLEGERVKEKQCSKKEKQTYSSLPLLQIWPSQDSHQREDDSDDAQLNGQENNVITAASTLELRTEFLEVSPSSLCLSSMIEDSSNSRLKSPTPSLRSAMMLHPNDARLSPSQSSRLDQQEADSAESQASPCCSSSSMSSVISIAHYKISSNSLQQNDGSSVATARYSLFDALDLENALMHVSVARGSLSESLHKLTFTQSLAFPALARNLASKRKSSPRKKRGRFDPSESGLNAFAKVATTLMLVLISFLVFGVVYKFVRT